MLDFWTSSPNIAFSAALMLMLMLALVQVLGLGDLLGGDADFDGDVNAEGGAIDAGLLSLIGVGRMPFLMWLMLFLFVFGLIGLSGQQLFEALTGDLLGGWLAAPLAAIAALPVTGLLARPIGAIIPRDETSAVTLSTLTGREAEIEIGTARAASPARARVRDRHGHLHHVMVEPADPTQSLAQGEKVLLVSLDGALFKATSRGDYHLPGLD